MESKRTATTYFIPPGKFLLMENALGNPDLIQSSVSSDCRVTIVDSSNFPLDELEQWPTFRLVSADTKLKLGDGAYYIYIVVPTPDNEDSSTAFIAYNTVRVNRDGYEIVLSEDEEGNSVETNGELLGKVGFKYYQCGTVSAQGANSSAVTVPAGKGRLIEMDLGVTPAPSTLPGGLNDFDKVFQLDKVDPSSPSSWLLTILTTIKTMTARLIRVTGSLIFGQGENEKAVTDVAVRADSDKETKVSDTIIASTAWVIAVTDDRFLRKDKDDETPFNLGVGQNLTVGQDVIADKDVIVGESTHSKDFVSGFVDGKGWAIRLKEWINAAGEKGIKSVGEFDEVIVRNLLRVYEFIISQLLGENDNRIFTGMMEVDHYDAADGKVYLKTDNGRLYNPFRVDDVIVVQQYGGNPSEENGYYVTKQYEFIVTEVGIGEMGEDRLDWVRFRNFTTSMEGGDESLITERDTLVRIDNLSDASRKGVIQLMSVGEDTPYMDFIYGAKTDPENSLKGRFGNISGIYNPLFGWLKEFGAYLTNLYAVGEFRIAHTGEDIADAIEILKGTFRTNFSQTSYDITEEADFFTNATFTNNCEYWELSDEETSYFTVGDVPQFFNYELYASENSFAGLSEYDGRSALRLTNGYAKQLNEHIRKPSTHTEYNDVNSSLDKVGEEVVDTLYLSVRVYAATDSVIEFGFTDSNGSFIENGFHHNESLEASKDDYTINLSGKWDGNGDFTIKGTGDVYIDHLSLTDDPLGNFKITTSTAIEQTAQSIKLMGTKITNEATTNLNLAVDALNGAISAQASRIDNVNNTINNSGWITSSTAVTIFSQQVTAQGIAKTADIKVYVDNKISGIKLTADQITIDGVTSVNKTFKIGADGYMTCIGGTIGGFTIKEKRLTASSGVNMILNAGEENSYPSIGWFGSASAAYASLGVVDTDGYIAGQLTMSKVGGGAMVVSPTSISISGANSNIVLSGSNVNSSVFTVLDIQNNSYDGRVTIGFRGSRIMFYSKNWPTTSSDVAIGEVYRDGNTLKVRTS